MILIAISIQNQMHPKNSNRRDAITNGDYQPIETEEEAGAFLNDILEKTLKNEL